MLVCFLLLECSQLSPSSRPARGLRMCGSSPHALPVSPRGYCTAPSGLTWVSPRGTPPGVAASPHHRPGPPQSAGLLSVPCCLGMCSGSAGPVGLPPTCQHGGWRKSMAGGWSGAPQGLRSHSWGLPLPHPAAFPHRVGGVTVVPFPGAVPVLRSWLWAVRALRGLERLSWDGDGWRGDSWGLAETPPAADSSYFVEGETEAQRGGAFPD